jgi:hypothetical protein
MRQVMLSHPTPVSKKNIKKVLKNGEKSKKV